jgi:beta-barrel assembly-enhancing protease
MNKYIALLIFYVLPFFIFAQKNETYKPLEAEGKIPKEFMIPSSIKYKSDVSKINNKAKKKEKKTRKKFALETNFVLDDMLRSGRVLFNDKVSVYLNKVANVLVENGETKLSKIKVYTLRSSSVNAFATSRGEVMVTLGLLSKLENEAQLAYILCHELTHVTEQHSLELFLDENGIGKESKDKDILRNGQVSNKILNKHSYNKELETEADLKGLERFKKTKYSTASLNTVFDILKNADAPYLNTTFDFKIFQDNFYILPASYSSRLWTVKPTTDVETTIGVVEEDDSLSTHPNVLKRKAYIGAAIAKDNNANKSDFLISKDNFNEIQQIARQELPILLLNESQYADAIYTAFLLLKENKQSFYAQKCLAKALYYPAKYKNDKFHTANSLPQNFEGEPQRVNFFLETIPDKELAVLALRYAWTLLQSHPKDSELRRMTQELSVILAEQKLDISLFINDMDANFVSKNLTAVPTSADGESMRDGAKLKWQDSKHIQEIKDTSNYWRFAFTKFVNDSAFTKLLNEGIKEDVENKEFKAFYESEKGKKLFAKERKREEKKGIRLGIDKIVVLNPQYVRIEEQYQDKLDFLSTEKGEINLKESIKEVVQKTDLKVEILDVNLLKENQIKEFNDIRYLNEFFSEQFDKYELTLTMGSQQAVVDSIAEKYGTDYFLLSGVVSLHVEKSDEIMKALLGSWTVVLFPHFAYNAIKPNYETLFYSILFDIKTGRRKVIKFETFESKDSGPLIKSHYYDTFKQINMKRKGEKMSSSNVENKKKK